MTNELEKTFFDTFGIEPYDRYLNCTENLEVDCNRNCNYCDKAEDVYCYPEITPNILLKLICILTRFYGELVLEQCLDVNDLKEQVLNIFIRTSYKDNFKHQVRTLFEEGN